jgi:hypothetical protein
VLSQRQLSALNEPLAAGAGFPLDAKPFLVFGFFRNTQYGAYGKGGSNP